MTQLVIKPDNVKILIHTDNLAEGASFFIPCLNSDKAVNQTTTAAAKEGIRLRHRKGVENGMYGVRFWRTK